MKLNIFWAALCVPALLISSCFAQAGGTGPDVIVGDLMTPANYGSVGNIAAFAIGTTSCNIGTQSLQWVANTSMHPVIGQTLYRLRNGRYEQVGQSWLKHGFTALAQNLCATCQNPGTGSLLGVNCSDPYTASLNGSQPGLGPKTEVNAATGVFTYPPSNPAYSGAIARRLQVAHADLDPALNAGALYFGESQYVTPDDAAAGNKNNNASYRAITVTQGTTTPYSISNAAGSSTQRQRPAVRAWQDMDASVSLTNVDVPSDGRIIVAFKSTALGGGNFAYEYAIQNLSSHRSVRGVTIPVTAGATITNIGFHDVPYHSSEPFTGATGAYTGTDWVGQVTGGSVVWMTESYATNQRGNAIRWGTTYNFRFESTGFPGDMVLELFRPGTPTTVTAPSTMPTFAISPMGIPATMLPGTPMDVFVQTTNITGAPDPATATMFIGVDGGPMTPTAMIQTGPNIFRGTLPGIACFHSANWYVSISALAGAQVVSYPAGGAAAPIITMAESPVLTTVIADNGETVVAGWSVANGPLLTDGPWDLAAATPVAGANSAAPIAAFGGTGKCFLTDNVATNSDVDGDETRLSSPLFSLQGFTDARLSYALWYDNDNTAGSNDSFRVEVSNNGGGTWVTVDTVAGLTMWQTRRIRLGQFIANFTNSMRVRFIASDFSPAHTIEAAMDNFIIETCPVGVYLPPLAAGNLGTAVGGPFSTLYINGTDGGGLHRVDVAIGANIDIAVDQPSFSVVPAPFVVCGYLGVPTVAEATLLPATLGTMVFPPALLAPANPLLFTLADGIGIGGAMIPGIVPPSPWVFSLPGGAPSPLQVTLQVVQVDATNANGLAVGNAVILNVQ
ncbi:MAG: hypothetical protein EXS14_10150 [Planctomycetes bacterium]|nr:hypothetical protein [Planctomycetota bacterium]